MANTKLLRARFLIMSVQFSLDYWSLSLRPNIWRTSSRSFVLRFVIFYLNNFFQIKSCSYYCSRNIKPSVLIQLNIQRRKIQTCMNIAALSHTIVPVSVPHTRFRLMHSLFETRKPHYDDDEKLASQFPLFFKSSEYFLP